MKNIIDEDILDRMPTKYQFGKMLIASVIGFAASKLAEKAFDAGYLRKIHKLSRTI